MEDKLKQLKAIIHNVPLKRSVLPEDENVNTIYRQLGSDGIMQLIHNASELEELEEVGTVNLVLPSIPEVNFEPPLNPEESLLEYKKHAAEQIELTANEWETPFSKTSEKGNSPQLESIHENKLVFRTPINEYSVLGNLSQDLSSMRITLMIEEIATGRKERTKIDLYEREPLRILSEQTAEMFSQSSECIEADLLVLTDLLEKHREKQFEQAKPSYQSKRQQLALSPENQKKCIEFLKQPDLIKHIDLLIEQAGVVGEESTRKLLFVIASTFKMTTPLHALVQGSSGSGKSHLINSIGQCLPPEDVMSMTRVTSKSFYHYTKNQLVDKVLLIQDFDGLDEEAQYAFRELQSAGNISSSTTYKDRFGNLVSAIKNVRSHFASLLATTKAELYYDNMSRSVIIGVDESEEQTLRIVAYQNKRLAGLIDIREEQKAKEFLQNCIRSIKPYEVVNRYADKIKLPIEAKMLRRLNSHYQAFVKQITILHQFQREKDERGRLITQAEDLKIACDILFDALMLKVDDLDSSLRQFFDRMKSFISEQTKAKGSEYQFTQREVRLALNVSKTQCFRYMEDLEVLEYVQKTGGYANRGFKYKIVYWDNMETVKDRIKQELSNQLGQLNAAA